MKKVIKIIIVQINCTKLAIKFFFKSSSWLVVIVLGRGSHFDVGLDCSVVIGQPDSEKQTIYLYNQELS